MNLDPIKPIGGFIENTIRPMLEEVQWFFDECDIHDIPINERNIKKIIDYTARAHFRTCIINLIQNVVICLLICATWLITVKIYRQ